jgi:hypothetical protein
VLALQVCGVPIGSDFLLGALKGDVSIADLFAQSVLQPIFFVRAGVLCVRLRPKVLRGTISAKLAADEVVNLATFRRRQRRTLQFLALAAPPQIR